MVSIIYITARVPQPFTDHPDWNQYEVLTKSLAAQTYLDFEVVCVTPFPEDTSCLAELEQLTIAVVPRDTPWRRARTFSPCASLNTGLIHARGDWCLVLGDCCELDPGLLARLAEWGNRGFAVALMVENGDGKLVDTRFAWFKEHRDEHGVVYLPRHGGQPIPQGLVFFPLAAALDINGYDEHLDGARGLDDVDFGYRMQQRGVPFVMDEKCLVRMYSHNYYPESVIKPGSEVVRCCNTAWKIARENNYLRANEVAYTKDEIRRRLECFMWLDGKCGYYGGTVDCSYPFAKDGHPTAKRIMLEEGEPLFDLRAERRKLGL